jgi:hypothetical protein
LVEQSPIL